MWGWTLMALGLFALAALVLTSGDIRDRLAGTGGRKISRRARLAQQRDEIAALKQQIEACPHCTPSEFPTIEELIVADALAGPSINVPAPVDAGCRDTPLANAETQPVDVHELRAAMGMGRTAVIPVTAVNPPLQVPAGPGSANPTEVSEATGRRAVVAVTAALDEAS